MAVSFFSMEQNNEGTDGRARSFIIQTKVFVNQLENW